MDMTPQTAWLLAISAIDTNRVAVLSKWASTSLR